MEIRREIDYSTRDYEGFRNDMIEMLKKKSQNTRILANQTQG